MTAIALLLLACSGGPEPSPDEPAAIEVTEKSAPETTPAPRADAGERRLPPFGPLPEAPRQNALLIVIDTLRADALAAARTPNIDSIAAAGQSVARAWSAGTWTVPSVISMMTGMPVRQHGWDLPTGRMGRYPPLPATETLAQALSAQGFTAAGLYANPYLAEALGFQRGFSPWRRVSDEVMAKEFGKLVMSEWSQPGRHFAYLHLIGPHSPLKPSPEARARWEVEDRWFEGARFGMDIGVAKRNREEGAREAYRRAYHAAIEDTDLIIGQVLAALGDEREDTLIVLTSDHGELLGEHKIVGHGYWVWEGLTHVPLIVEGGPPLPQTLGLASVPGLITHGLGLDITWPTVDHQWVRGVPLSSQREGKLALSPDGDLKGVWHEAERPDEVVVFGLTEDPLEERPRPEGDALRALRASWEAVVPAGGVSAEAEVQLSGELREELEALGYVDEDKAPADGAGG